MEWNNHFKIGYAKIDKQHEKLVGKLNNLILLSKKNDLNVEKFKIALQLLESYCLLHFSTEENIMIKIDYPMLKKHKEQHKNFILALNEIKLNFDKEGITQKLLEEIEESCTYWLKGHIASSDQEIQSYIIENGIEMGE